jgi:hypothetical protein
MTKDIIEYCNGCATAWVKILELDKCTYCNKPIKEIGWVEHE